MDGNHQQEITSFSRAAKELLGFYVYRLVDPRNGQTFYVGKGKNDRVFQHMRGVSPRDWKDRSNDEEVSEESAKISLIKEILSEQLKVICFIHRHDMNEDIAYEVEGALIDAYGTLTNAQTGRDNRIRGCMCVDQIEKKARAKEVQFDDAKDKFVIIKIRRSTLSCHNGIIYEAVRGNWVIDPRRAKRFPVLACVDGMIEQAFTVNRWEKSTPEKVNGRQRFIFSGEPSQELTQRFSGMFLPKNYRRKGQANPIRYIHC